MIAFKLKLYRACEERVAARLAMGERAMHDIQSAANEETKSSAGDKYETGRAMMHLEKEKIAEQLADASKMRAILSKIDPEKENEEIGLGSLIQTAQGYYFLAASLGQLEVEDMRVFVISPVSPVGQALIGKRQGESFLFAGKSQNIIEVW